VSGYGYVGGFTGYDWQGGVSNSHYNIDKVIINGGHYPTLGGLFDSQYNDWLSHGLRLNISDYSSTLIPAGGYYLINSVQGLKDLLGFADMNYKFRLAADLDLSSEPNLYIPYFAGEFDGNNHTVSNLNINMTFASELGFFGHNSGTVKNVSVVNVSVSGGYYVGGLVGYNFGTVNNSHTTGDVSGSDWYVGGLVGRSDGTVSNSYATGNVNGSERVGGLVGYNFGTVNNSHATGDVSGTENVGGLVGWNDGILSNCYATGDVSGTERVGGLIGKIYYYWGGGITMSNCYATGNVSGSNNYVGGLVGELRSGMVSNSYATGNVSGSGFYVGGFVGELHKGVVSNSYATGNVNGSETVGGLVGYSYYATVRYTYAAGRVNGSSNVGGLIGYRRKGVVIASFWDINTTGQTTSAGGTGKTTDEMKNKTTFTSAGWDFTNIWDIWEGRTYPFFKWQDVKAVPLEPLNLSVRSGNRYVNLSWEKPLDDGGSPIIGYRIYRGTSSGNETYLTMVGGNATTYNDTGVTNGQTYYYRVSAVNGIGEGELSEEVSAVPLSVPSAPRNLVARAGDGYVVLTWEVPLDDGGLPITGYKIYRGTSLGNETLLATVRNETTYYHDTGLTNGQRYYYRVSAVNGIGEGELSIEVNATPQTIPSAPRNLVARAGNRYVVLTWEAPADDGGSPITEYKIYRGTSPGNEVLLTMVGNVLTYNDTGVTNGQRYYYRVSAVNGIGEGELSEEVSAVPLSVPSAPRNLVARGGDGYVVLTWEVPLDDGGLPITGYKIYRGTSSGNETLLITVGKVLTYNNTRLTNGQRYYYRVSAVNVVGEGELSEEVSATPQTIPSAPQNLVARAGDGYVVLTWEAPADDGGSSITGYRIYRGISSVDETLLTMVGNVLTYNDTGVTNGQRYYYRVSAVNVVGEGELSEEVSATPQTVEIPQTVPSAPRNLVARGGDGYVVLTWEAPADDGGLPITGYRIYRGISSVDETLLTMVGNVLTYNDTGVTNGQRYYYRVSAVNDVGEGELSAEVSATPQSAPTTGTSTSGGVGGLLLLGALLVVIVAIVLIVLFAIRRKGESGESEVTFTAE